MSINKAKGRRGHWKFNKETGQLERLNEPPKVVQAPFVHTDEIPPTLSMTGTDKVYTSKARLRAEYRELGYIETGGEQAKPESVDKEKRRKELRESVEKAINDNRYGMAPISEREKETVKREEYEWNQYKNRNR